MSIRLLTAGLQTEAEEKRRRQHYQAARLPNLQDTPSTRESAFLSGSGQRNTEPAPSVPSVPQAPQPRQVNLQARTAHNPWGVPGGIAARFGQGALRQPESHPIEEPQTTDTSQTIEPPATEQQTNETTQASTKDENASITIELQSH